MLYSQFFFQKHTNHCYIIVHEPFHHKISKIIEGEKKITNTINIDQTECWNKPLHNCFDHYDSSYWNACNVYDIVTQSQESLSYSVHKLLFKLAIDTSYQGTWEWSQLPFFSI